MFFGSRSHDDIYIDMIEVNEIKNFDENNKIINLNGKKQ